jgi:hypothetical protein
MLFLNYRKDSPKQGIGELQKNIYSFFKKIYVIFSDDASKEYILKRPIL